jgi:hypothetical protein
MIVLLAGMPRSGSTFCFNIVREVLSRRGRIHQEPTSDVVGAVHRSKGADYVLVKTHDLDVASLALVPSMRIIITIRRVEDAIASWHTTFDTVSEEASVAIMRAWLRLYCQLRSRAVLVPYWQTDHLPWLAAWRIAHAVCPTVGLAEVVGIARRFRKADVKRKFERLSLGDSNVVDVGFSHFDSITFFHRRHVSAVKSRTAEQAISQERLSRVRAALATDIAATGLR